jgi:predicted RNA-binding Zn ribbon-like protein
MTPPGSLAIELTHTRNTERDRLADYGAVVDWAERNDVVSPDRAARLREAAAAHPRRAAAAHAKAVKLREAVYRILRAAGEGEAADPADLTELNTMLRRASTHRALVQSREGHTWSWVDEDTDALEALLWPVAFAAADLLTSEWTGRVGVCRADTCQWLFIDESRNHSRRWCDMSDCGTREKVRRFRARAKRKD